jgi:hypothetical protein
MKGVDAEHIKLRNHEIESICHGMGALPIVIGYSAEMAARAAAETLIAMQLVHTIRPWHLRFEKAKAKAVWNRNIFWPECVCAIAHRQRFDRRRVRGLTAAGSSFFANQMR